MFLPTFLLTAVLQAASAAPPQVVPHHELNFESERKQADDLFNAKKEVEALPLYVDLCRQDPTVALFAERYGRGLLAKETTMNEGDPNARLQIHLQGIKELRRAVALGDTSVYVRTLLDLDTKTLPGAILAGVPITVGYSYAGNAQAQAPFQEGNAAFSRKEFANAAEFYKEAAALDPAWYTAALFTGDAYYTARDWNNAGSYFAKAIAIDPDRETAYRYWGDMMMKTNNPITARQEYVLAVVAEPYGNEAVHRLGEWAAATHHQLVTPIIQRPGFVTSAPGVLTVDPVLQASTQDGRSSWIVYQQYLVAQGARQLNLPIIAGGIDAQGVVTPNGYHHTIEQEHAALRAMLADVDARIKSGTLVESNLDPSIANIRKLEAAKVLGAWICINAADAGIRADYPAYRSHHRTHLYGYIYTYLIRDTPATP